MGRKSALTPEQWNEIERRILVENESVLSLAAEFGINESSIRRRIKPNKADQADKAERAQKHFPELREIAMRKVEADAQSRQVAEEIAQLPFAKQEIVADLSRRLSNISEHLASAAELSAATAQHLAGIAHTKARQIDASATLDEEGIGSLKGVAVLTKMANEASNIGLNLLAANKDAIAEARKRGEAAPARVRVTVEDASVPEPDAFSDAEA